MTAEPYSAEPWLIVQKTLPKGVSEFIGREEELRQLLDAGGGTRPCPVRVVQGMLGVGKSALVAEAARILADDYDEHFYIDLRASYPWPVHREDAVAGLLAVDGMDQGTIAKKLPQLVEQWHARVADRRLLLVLDDANDKQARAIVPRSNYCLVLITTSEQLSGDLVDEAVHLDVPDRKAAARMFLTLAHRQSSTEDTAAVAELVDKCDRLPLAMAALADLLKRRKAWSVAKLRDDWTHRPGLVKGRDWRTRVEQALEYWYDGLPAESGCFLRRLTLHPGVEIDRYAAAALNGIQAHEADEHLDELYQGHLLTERAAERYRMHKLVRDYVHTRSLLEESPQARDAATARLLDYYEYTADAAGRWFDRRARLNGQLPVPACGHPSFAGRAEAAAWFRAERPNLLACAAYAYQKGEATEYERVVRLAAAMAEFLRQQGPWDKGVELHEHAVASASATGDVLGEARARFNKASLIFRRAERKPDYEEADTLLQSVHRLCQEVLDKPSTGADPETAKLMVAEMYSLLGHVKWMTDDEAAEWQVREALRAFRDAKDRLGEADVCKQLSDLLRTTSPNESEELARRAVELCAEIQDELGEANALDSLGLVLLFKGESTAAAEQFKDCLTRYRGLGSRIGEANSQLHLASALRLTGRYKQARHAADAGLAIYKVLGVRQGKANALKAHSAIVRMTGELSLAVQHSRDAVKIYDELGESMGRAEALDGLGIALRLKGEYGEAAQQLKEAAELYDRHGQRFGKAEALSHLAVVMRLTGEFERATHLLDEALAEFRQVQHPFGQANALQQLGTIRRLTARGPEDFRAADDLLKDAGAIFSNIANPLGMANVLAGRAVIKGALGDLVAAKNDLENAVDRYRQLGDGLGMAEALNHWGELLRSSSDWVEGLARHRTALRIAREVHSPLEQGRAHHGAAHCLLDIGDEAQALVDMREAARIFADIRAFQVHYVAKEAADLEARATEQTSDG